MKFTRLTVLLPAAGLDDLGLDRDDVQADELLGAWSAMWHPALLAGVDNLPSWSPATTPPHDPAGQLIVVPPFCEPLLPADWPAAAAAAQALVIRGAASREDVLRAALPHAEPPVNPVDPELAADFMALAVGHFYIEVLTRQLRYMSNLDESTLQSRTLEAAAAAVRGEVDAARGALQTAFDLLLSAREYFYPVEAHLLDLTLATATTIGAPLRAELSRPIPTNLLISAQAIEVMAEKEPETLAALRTALAENRAVLIGGEFLEGPLPLLPPEAVATRLEQGLAVYERHLGRRPLTFGRRRFGLSAALPQILRKFGFQGGLHFTLDDGRFPVGNQSRLHWEGLDGGATEVLARLPLDAGRSETFLRLTERIGEVLDLDHAATLVFAHWPGHASRWYGDLQRVAGYTNALGRFHSLTDYLHDTQWSGQNARYAADEYRSAYLRQDVQGARPDPISRYVDYYRQRTLLDVRQTLVALESLLRRTPPAETTVAPHTLGRFAHSPWEHELEAALDASRAADAAWEARVTADVDATLARLRPLLAAGEGPSGVLVVNPWTFSREVRAATFAPHPGLRTPAASENLAWPEGTVEVPGMGFAWIGPQPPAEPSPSSGRWTWFRGTAKKEPPPLAESGETHALRNEFFEAIFSSTTGGVQSVSDYQSRNSRYGQQLAMRLSQGRKLIRDEWGHKVEDLNHAYTRMVADEIRVSACSDSLGEITSRGRLIEPDGPVVARFEQIARVRRGSRVLELEITLAPERLPEDDPWKSYYALRSAWADDVPMLRRGLSLAGVPTDQAQFEAPHYVDIQRGALRTTLLCGGLPYHRRNGLHMLDTLLIVRGESARSFRLGVAFDVRSPLAAALEFLAPQTLLRDVPRPRATSGWLFHVDVRNVIATRWEPLLEAGRVTGFRVRLLETEGRRVAPKLRAFRNLAAAKKLRPGEEPPLDLPTHGDCVRLELNAYEWADVECVWNG